MQEDTPIVTNHEASIDETEVPMITASGVEMTASGVQTIQNFEPAYVVRDRYFPDFAVRPTSHGWWKDSAKVHNLILAFKNGHPVDVALVYAGISWDQYKYFLKFHPEFSAVRKACQKINFLRAQETVTGDLQAPETAKWFLGKRDPRYGSKSDDEGDDVEEDKKAQPQVHINQGVIINNNGITAGQIQEIAGELVSRLVREIRGEEPGDIKGDSVGGTEGSDQGGL